GGTDVAVAGDDCARRRNEDANAGRNVEEACGNSGRGISNTDTREERNISTDEATFRVVDNARNAACLTAGSIRGFNTGLECCLEAFTEAQTKLSSERSSRTRIVE